MNNTVFTEISVAAFITFFMPQVQRLIEGCAYSQKALIWKLDATKKSFLLI